jgi:hypothetical protein
LSGFAWYSSTIGAGLPRFGRRKWGLLASGSKSTGLSWKLAMGHRRPLGLQLAGKLGRMPWFASARLGRDLKQSDRMPLSA